MQPVWATLTQTTGAAPYRGTRLALTAYLRVADVDAPAGGVPRLRVNGPSGAACGPDLLAFDNMYGRRITGSHDWRPYTLVVDVPQQATMIAFGVHLNGGGIVWADDFALFAVGPEVPVTDDLALIPNARDALCPGAPTPAPAVLTPVVATPRAAPTAGVGPLRPAEPRLRPPPAGPHPQPRPRGHPHPPPVSPAAPGRPGGRAGARPAPSPATLRAAPRAGPRRHPVPAGGTLVGRGRV